MTKQTVQPKFNYDYEKIGFKAGLEIHAQLESDRKLFCHCKPDCLPPQVKPDYFFERRFRSVLGEMGDFDAGMLVEFEKAYRVIYETYDDTICTYEMDETPPFYPDFNVIKKGFMIGKLFNCKSTVDEIIFNRKQYLDGSIPTGFQRTAIVARDGFITTKKGNKIRINNILVEEDAARRVNFIDRANRTVYFNLDRLGIPLTEIITNHEDCRNPNELFEIALLLGLSLRVLGVAKRGIGTIRQDVNISIEGGARVELKGIQNIYKLKDYSDREITRQLSLLKIRDLLKEKGVSQVDFQTNFIDVSSAIINQMNDTATAFAIRLPKCAGILLTEVQPDKLFGEEVFDRIELITGIPMKNITHSDQPAEWLDDKHVRNIMNLFENDSYIVVRGKQKPVLHALNRLIERLKYSLIGVPEETRRIIASGNSEFLRVIHGKDRMYSDTDTPPISVSNDIRDIEITNIVKPWELFSSSSISILELKFIIEKGFYNEFSVLWQKYPTKIRTLIGLFQACHHIIRDNSLNEKIIAKMDLSTVIADILERNISNDSLKEILFELSQNKRYTEIRNQFQSNLDQFSDDDRKKIRGVLLENSNSLDIPLGRIFGIIRTHFPMFSTEQILSILKKENLIKERI